MAAIGTAYTPGFQGLEKALHSHPFCPFSTSSIHQGNKMVFFYLRPLSKYTFLPLLNLFLGVLFGG